MFRCLFAVATLLTAFTMTSTAADPPKFEIVGGFSVNPGIVADKPCDEGCRPATIDDQWFACQISVAHPGGVTSYGSGTPLASENAKTLVLTNAHVVRDGTRPITVTAKGKAYVARYVTGSTVTDTGPNTISVDGPDLCILEVDANLGGVTLADESPAIGARVFQCGFGGSQDGKPIVKSGVVSVNPTAKSYLASTIPAAQGDSGCGVFNADGQLVGVTWGGNTVALAETATTVRTFVLKAANKFRLFPRLRDRLEARQARRAAAAALSAIPVIPLSNAPPQAPAPKPKEGPGFESAPPKKEPPKAAPPKKEPLKAAAPATVTYRYEYAGRDRRGVDHWRLVPNGVSGSPDCPDGKCPLKKP